MPKLNPRQFDPAKYPDGRVPMEDTPLHKWQVSEDTPMGADAIKREAGREGLQGFWNGEQAARTRPVRIGPGFQVGGRQKALHAPALEHYLKGGESLEGDEPVVARFPDGRQQLIQGHHRFTAALMQGNDEVPSRVYDVGRRRWI